MIRALFTAICLLVFLLPAGAEEERGGLFVAVGDGGRLITSLDGMTWKDDPSWSAGGFNKENPLFNVVFGAGKFVAVGGSLELGRIVSSRNGREWTAAPPLEGRVGTIAFGNGRFIAGHEGGLLHSLDGENFAPGARLDWEGRIAPLRSACGDTEAGFRTVIIGDWQPTTETRRLSWRGVTSDGTRWDHAASDTAPARDVAYGSGHFVVVGPGGLIESSHDGESWQRHEIASPEDFSRIVWTGTRFIVSGGKLAWASPDGLTWKPETFTIPCSLAWAQEGWLALGFTPDGRLHASTDFSAWKTLPIRTGPALQAVTFGCP